MPKVGIPFNTLYSIPYTTSSSGIDLLMCSQISGPVSPVAWMSMAICFALLNHNYSISRLSLIVRHWSLLRFSIGTFTESWSAKLIVRYLCELREVARKILDFLKNVPVRADQSEYRIKCSTLAETEQAGRKPKVVCVTRLRTGSPFTTRTVVMGASVPRTLRATVLLILRRRTILLLSTWP